MKIEMAAPKTNQQTKGDNQMKTTITFFKKSFKIKRKKTKIKKKRLTKRKTLFVGRIKNNSEI